VNGMMGLYLGVVECGYGIFGVGIGDSSVNRVRLAKVLEHIGHGCLGFAVQA
jgi:hypothetical protein